jgi:hypothetical protein
MIKIETHLVSKKNCKVHLQNTIKKQGLKTVFWAEIVGKTGFEENDISKIKK